MSKTIKKVSSYSSWSPGFKMLEPESKKEKPGGKRYCLLEDYTGILLAMAPCDIEYN